MPHAGLDPQPYSAAVPAIAKAQNLQRRYGHVTALSGVTFELERGITGLLGANGAGKTTLMRLLLGLLRPHGGSLEILGMDPLKAGPKLRGRVGYAPEDDRFPPDMKVHELVRHFAEMRGIPRRAAVVRANEVLLEVGLGEERFRPFSTMSTGQRQRVKLAQAVVHDPEVVLLDEPTNGLDPIQRDDMLALIRRLGTELGFAVLVSSHLLHEIEQVADRIIMIEGGRVARSGSLAEIQSGHQQLYLEVVNRAPQLAAALAGTGVEATAAGETRVWVASGPEAADRVVAQVIALDLELVRMEPRGATLEDLFDVEAPAG